MRPVSRELKEALEQAQPLSREQMLVSAAEQFLAIVKDGNVAELQDYLVDIFTEALKVKP